MARSSRNLHQRRRSYQPRLDALEDRWVPSTAIQMPAWQYLAAPGTLTFSSATGNAVTISGGPTNVTETAWLQVDRGASIAITNPTPASTYVSYPQDHLIGLTGTEAQINADLQSLAYTAPTTNFTGSGVLDVFLPNTGPGSWVFAYTTIQFGGDSLFVTVPNPIGHGQQYAGTATWDRPLVFSPANGTAINVYDSGGNSAVVTAWVQAGYGDFGAGTLSLGSTAGLTSVTGNGTRLIGMTGPLANVNAALDGLSFNVPRFVSPMYNSLPYYQGTVGLSVLAFDNATGLQSSQYTLMQVGVGNTPPTVDGPHAQSASAAGPLTFSAANGNAITVTDLDSAGADEVVHVQALTGTLTAGNTSGLTAASGNGSSLLTLTGPVTALNTALDGLTYQAATGTTTDTLSVTINDQGHMGIVSATNLVGQPMTASLGVAITVDPTPDVAPTASGPASQAIKAAGVTFAAANGNAITVADGDANWASETLTVQVLTGNLTPGNTSGVSVTTAPHTLILAGSIYGLNQALDGLTYTPAAGSTTDDTLSLLISDGTKTGSAHTLLPFTTATNVAPTISAPASLTVTAGGYLALTAANGAAIQVADGDAGGGQEVINVLAGSGQLGYHYQGIYYGWISPNPYVSVSGPLTTLNAVLHSMVYVPAPGATSDTLTVTIYDLGNSGGPAQSASVTVPITITG